jgi:Sulfotransferase family
MDVISVHVPKTAGSTFGKLLAKVYGDERIVLDYQDLPMNPLSPYNSDHEAWKVSASAEVQSIGPGFRAVHGHFPVQKYEGAFPEARRIAWVRHPASWVISLYYFWKNVPTTTHPLVQRLHAEDISIDEFAQDPTVRNRISSVFLGGRPLEAFAFLGIQEHFNEDFATLVRMMGWPEIESDVVNESPEPRYSDRRRELYEDDRLIDRLISLNEKDMALYEEALRLRARRLDQAKAQHEKHVRRAAIRAKLDRDRREKSARTA